MRCSHVQDHQPPQICPWHRPGPVADDENWLIVGAGQSSLPVLPLSRQDMPPSSPLTMRTRPSTSTGGIHRRDRRPRPAKAISPFRSS